MRLAVYATPFRNETFARQAHRFILEACSRGHELRLATATVEALGQYGHRVTDVPHCKEWSAPSVPRLTDYVVSLGGDGTFLRAARWSGQHQIPIVGVNLGHLGYLPAFNPTELDTLIERLESGDFDIEWRTMLQIDVPADMLPANFDTGLYALNEIAIMKQDTASMISIPVHMNGLQLGVYRADGLIVSTPTGSTGYNLSVGGPVLQPTVPAFVLSPIADHSLTMRPMVISSAATLQLTATGRANAFRVSIDGNSFTLPAGCPLTIARSPFSCGVIVRKGTLFSSTLRSKLLWGETTFDE